MAELAWYTTEVTHNKYCRLSIAYLSKQTNLIDYIIVLESNYIKENPKTVSVHYLERAPRPQFQS